jgi:protein-S-isoprenylcysteine O-methyltransferase Ste14
VVAQSILISVILVAGPLQGKAFGFSVALGVPFFALGATIGILGVRHLGSARSALPEPLPGAPLVQEGIYARVRHPLYTSLLSLSAGWTLMWRSPTSAAASVLLLALLLAKARTEEIRLLRLHPGYAAYRSRVPAFLPRWL